MWYTHAYLLVHFQLQKEKVEAICKGCFKIKTDYCFLQQFYFKKVHKSVMELQHFKILDLFLQIHEQYLYFRIPFPQKCEYKTSYWNSYRYSSPRFVHGKHNIRFWIPWNIIAPISFELCLSARGPTPKGPYKAPIKCIKQGLSDTNRIVSLDCHRDLKWSRTYTVKNKTKKLSWKTAIYNMQYYRESL